MMRSKPRKQKRERRSSRIEEGHLEGYIAIGEEKGFEVISLQLKVGLTSSCEFKIMVSISSTLGE